MLVVLLCAFIWTLVLICLHLVFCYTLWYTQSNIFFCPPAPLRTQRMAYNNDIKVGGRVVDGVFVGIYHLFGVYDICTCCLQFTLFNITHRNPCLLRWRALLINEINVGGGGCCPHIFGPWCSPAKQGLFADAHRLTRKCWWWVVLVVKRSTQQPTHPPTNTHRPVPTRSPCKVAQQWQRS